jgi:GxxExxY protein
MSNLDFERISRAIIRAFYNVYNELGPGLSELVYQRALAIELQRLGVHFALEVRFPVLFRGVEVGHYRADLVVADTIIVEIKCAESIARQHVRQSLYYLKASGLSLALILNFGPQAIFKRVIR